MVPVPVILKLAQPQPRLTIIASFFQRACVCVCVCVCACTRACGQGVACRASGDNSRASVGRQVLQGCVGGGEGAYL